MYDFILRAASRRSGACEIFTPACSRAQWRNGCTCLGSGTEERSILGADVVTPAKESSSCTKKISSKNKDIGLEIEILQKTNDAVFVTYVVRFLTHGGARGMGRRRLGRSRFDV